MEQEAAAELQRRRPPWRRTVAVQAALCLALYAAFSLGEPQLRPRGGDALGSGGRGGGVSFLSVAGGARPPADQARLLSQMESIAKVYGVKLVLDVAQFGDDPLWQNGSLHFQALNIPWYSTTSHGQIVDNFVKKVKMPYDQILEIIGFDTGPLQELLHDGKMSNSSREQITWLEQTLALSSSNWKIVVGYDPLVDCNEVHTAKVTQFREPLRQLFEAYAVDAYVSTGGSCGQFHQDNSVLYIQNPIPGVHTNLDGFLLHRVSPLEMESLSINLEGEIVQRSAVHQQGRGAMVVCLTDLKTSSKDIRRFKEAASCDLNLRKPIHGSRLRKLHQAMTDLQASPFQQQQHPYQVGIAINELPAADQTTPGGASEVTPLPQGPPRRVGEDKPLEGMRVLLVEDTMVLQTIQKKMLTALGAAVEIARDGSKAVAMFTKSLENASGGVPEILVDTVALPYDVIFMDCQMPVMDGYEATKCIRQEESRYWGMRTPIIALTAYAEEEDLQETIQAGMDLHLTKPIQRKRIVEAVYQVCKQGR